MQFLSRVQVLKQRARNSETQQVIYLIDRPIKNRLEDRELLFVVAGPQLLLDRPLG